MKDEEIALELLRIQQIHGTYLTSDEIVNVYESILDKLENKGINNKIAEIKQVFKDNEYKPGAWTGFNATNMLDKIKKIIDNKEV